MVHHVVGLEIPVHDAHGVRGVDRTSDLRDDGGDFVRRERCVALGVALQQLARGPLDHQERKPFGLAGLDGADHIRVRHAGAEARLTHEARDRGAVLPQLFAQYLERDSPVHRMFGTVHRGGATLPDAVEEGIASQSRSNERVASHAAKLPRPALSGKRLVPNGPEIDLVG